MPELLGGNSRKAVELLAELKDSPAVNALEHV